MYFDTPSWLPLILGLVVGLVAAVALTGRGPAIPVLSERDTCRGAPDERCTPGARVHVTRAQACRRELRDGQHVGAAVAETVRSRYGRDDGLAWRVPRWLGGVALVENVYPASLADRRQLLEVERRARWRVCVKRSLSVKGAARWFRGDWRIHARARGE